MGFFARAVITGFGFTLGALLLRKVAKQLGIDDPLYAAHVAVPNVPAQSQSSQPAPAE